MQHTVTATIVVPAAPIATPIPRAFTSVLPPERPCEVDIVVFRNSKRRDANNQKHVTYNGVAMHVLY